MESSYFIFFFIFVLIFISQVLRGDPDPTGMRKEVEDAEESLKLQAIWDFEVRSFKKNLILSEKKTKTSFLSVHPYIMQGYLKYSPIFYGYYSKTEMTSEGMKHFGSFISISITHAHNSTPRKKYSGTSSRVIIKYPGQTRTE